MNTDGQAEEMKVCSNLPQPNEAVPENSSAGNQPASSVWTTRNISKTKAVIDMEFENLNETSQLGEVMPDNLSQESIKLGESNA
ncbi:hypothetical protein MLD38_010700 [Melastoma candidum]|uniref:Uncharacterized protein n=1 Tax=Melastoma candidum TaxID=119954 RepID=A0ACB9R0Q9_9MYRT|nr:hypothetical protein MLD38_010700 [Melastoma candidum]